MTHDMEDGGVTKLALWAVFAAGFGWSAMIAIPASAWAVVALAQGSIPEFSVKEWTSLGGFAIFAGAMYFLHRQSIQEFRADLKEERVVREKMTLAVMENTVATRELSHALATRAAGNGVNHSN